MIVWTTLSLLVIFLLQVGVNRVIVPEEDSEDLILVSCFQSMTIWGAGWLLYLVIKVTLT